MRDTPLERAPLAPTRPKPQVRMTRRLAGFDALEATAAAAFQGSINSGLLLALDAVGRDDLPPSCRTSLKLVKSVNQENDGHEEEQVHRRTNHRLHPAG